MKINTLIVAGFLMFAPVTYAGPIFKLVGGGGISPLHLDPGVAANGGKMVASGHWGISATGGGFMDGIITFKDGFVLPTAPLGTTTFSAADIETVTFDHSVPALTATTSPILGFSASSSQITFASGTIVFDGSNYAMTNASATGAPQIRTSIGYSTFLPLYGAVSGTFGFHGSVMELTGVNSNNTPTTVRMIPNSQADGNWQLTGYTTSVPAPSGLLLLLAGLIFLGVGGTRQRLMKPGQSLA